MKLAIHQPQYVPWLGYFDKMVHADHFVFLDDVQFKKNDWQNRNRLRSNQGTQWLTVPIQHQFGQHINQVDIKAQSRWTEEHQNALRYTYQRAPYYEKYAPHFDLLWQQSWTSLCHLNMAFIDQIRSSLNLETPYEFSSGLSITSSGTQRLVDICLAVGADTYIAGGDALSYMDPALFAKHNIHILYQEYTHPVYDQMAGGETLDFISHLSVIDLLLNHGPDSLAILHQPDSLKETV